MFKSLFFFFLLFLSMQSFSQNLIYKSNGTILNSENQKITPNQVRELVKDNEKLLAEYNAGRTKKTIGNILLISGFGLLVGDLIHGATSSGLTSTPVGGGYYSIQSERTYPTALTYVGLAALLIAIPVKIGFAKKIKNVVSDYNKGLKVGSTTFKIQKTEFLTNQNGLGIRLTLN
ncbi:hypothetical protein [Flavobacterium restrictum]|uniref:Uncharacterized protein n=1 Tax=Flavobacterium restrictum TaxID=2594428 RepID=A0A553E7U7_9FLAO|nr:hypothetical protein [Flavobacterium restrictum]TRX40903.1 hypothetical protein FNW21_06285 [Flavobacterium restrictum]